MVLTGAVCAQYNMYNLLSIKMQAMYFIKPQVNHEALAGHSATPLYFKWDDPGDILSV